MAERLVDRTEKGAALALPFLRGEPIGNAIEVFVLPAVVARQALDIGTVDHDALITVMAGHNRSITASLGSPMPAIHDATKENVDARHKSLHLGPPKAGPECRT